MIKKTIPQKFVRVLSATDKTLIAEETQIKKHPKYEKTYKRHRKYVIQNDNTGVKVGDEIYIIATKPVSKTKRWRIDSKSKPKAKGKK